MANELEKPVLAVDVVLFSLVDGQLVVLLERRESTPHAGQPGLPGVALRADETLLEAAHRALRTKTELEREAIGRIHLEQLASFDALDRDPRGRTVSVAYLGLLRPPVTALTSDIWHPVAERTAPLAFDHDAIMACATERLRGKLRYTNLAGQLLPSLFRIEELRSVYEAILGQELNRSNFRTKLLKLEIIEAAGVGKPSKRGGRPPHLYRFTRREVHRSARDFI